MSKKTAFEEITDKDEIASELIAVRDGLRGATISAKVALARLATQNAAFTLARMFGVSKKSK